MLSFVFLFSGAAVPPPVWSRFVLSCIGFASPCPSPCRAIPCCAALFLLCYRPGNGKRGFRSRRLAAGAGQLREARTGQHSFSPCHAQGDKQDAENTNSSSNTSWALAGVLLPFFSPPVVPHCPPTQQLSPEIKVSPQCHQHRLRALLTGTQGGEETVLPRFLFHGPFVPGLHRSRYVKSLQNLSELKASASPTGTRGLINRLHGLLVASKKQPSIFLE